MDEWQSDMIKYNNIYLNERLIPIVDTYMSSLKKKWYTDQQISITQKEFIALADDWFKSSKLVTLHGWETYSCIDVIMGCTHFIESFVIKYGWDNFQILTEEYGYYGMMGKYGTPIGELTPNMPLIVSLPNWKYGDIRPEWSDILAECEQKNIDIHIDFAWITVSKNINLDITHPSIKSFAMSLSKYGMQWNRIGLRWSKQRSMDSITMLNHYYGDVNSGLMSCGAFVMNNLSRDYIWETYDSRYNKLCKDYNLLQTKLAHVVRIPDRDAPLGVAHLLNL